MKARLGLSMAFAVLAGAGAVRAQFPSPFTAVTPQSINYQGRLTTPEGAAYTDGVYNVEFRLWPASTGGTTPLWGVCYAVYVKGGYFNVILGAPGGTLLTSTYSNDLWKALWYDGNPSSNTRYVGIKVLNDASGNPLNASETSEAFPRQQLLCAPFAERAQFAQYANGSAGDFMVRSKLTVSGQIDGNGGMDISGGAILLNNNVTVSGTATFTNGIVVNNQVADFNKGLDVAGAKSYLRAGAEVQGLAELKGGATVTGNLSATADISGANVNATGKIREGNNSLIPRGVIVMWSGTTAPAGWALCDGNNSTPNLKGRFIVGYDPNDADYNAMAKTGGEKRHTLTIAEMPAHTHQYWDVRDSDSYPGMTDGEGSGDDCGRRDNERTSGSKGDGASHENRPPYYTLAYIMKL